MASLSLSSSAPSVPASDSDISPGEGSDEASPSEAEAAPPQFGKSWSKAASIPSGSSLTGAGRGGTAGPVNDLSNAASRPNGSVSTMPASIVVATADPYAAANALTPRILTTEISSGQSS